MSDVISVCGGRAPVTSTVCQSARLGTHPGDDVSPDPDAVILAVAIVLLVAALVQMRRAVQPVLPVVRAMVAGACAFVLVLGVVALLFAVVLR